MRPLIHFLITRDEFLSETIFGMFNLSWCMAYLMCELAAAAPSGLWGIRPGHH